MKIKSLKVLPRYVFWDVANTPAGKLVCGWDEENAICIATYLHNESPEEVVARWKEDWQTTKFTKGKLEGNILKMDVGLFGTKFQQAVWAEVAKTKSGTTRTYAEIAKAIGSPRGARPVGTACSANPIHYIIPCHRILHSDGSLCKGFIEIQEKLLKDEGALRSRSPCVE